MYSFLLVVGVLLSSISFSLVSTNTHHSALPNKEYLATPLPLDTLPPTGQVTITPIDGSKKRKKPKKSAAPKKQKTPKEKTPKKVTRTPKTKQKNSAKAPKKTKTLKEETQKKAKTKRPRKSKIDTSKLTIVEQIELLGKKPSTPPQADLIHPTTIQQCAMAFDVVDEFTGRQKKGVAPRTFFTFTPPSYRKFLKDKEFIVCQGYLTQSTGELMALTLQLTIASKEAGAKFGAILPNSNLVISTMEGKNYLLRTYGGAKPVLEGDAVIYECSYSIEKEDLKKLRTAEIDQTQLTFEKGNFTYDVYYLDFLKDQFPCFD